MGFHFSAQIVALKIVTELKHARMLAQEDGDKQSMFGQEYVG
jgi:hypothetical protein